jgi:hypothetical protein
MGQAQGGINNLGLNLEGGASFMINGGAVGIGLGSTTPGATLDVTGSIRASSSITAGGNVTANGKTATVADEGSALKIIRGTVSSSGGTQLGGGYVPSRSSAGTYSITFSAPFSDVPTVTANTAPTPAGYTFCQVKSATASGVVIEVRGTDGGYYDQPFGFIAVGPR